MKVSHHIGRALKGAGAKRVLPGDRGEVGVALQCFGNFPVAQWRQGLVSSGAAGNVASVTNRVVTLVRLINHQTWG